MADSKKASLILELKDMASAGIAKVTGAMGSLVSVAAGVTAGLAVLFAGMMKSLAAYGEQEAAISKLNNALSNQGIKSQAVTNDLIKFADEMQNTSVFADEVVLSTMALGVTFGLTGERLKATTRAAADMSSALGIDLKTTMMLLGKASVGETGTLTRYGIVIGDNVPRAERFAAALAQVNARFGGSASAQAATYAGQMEVLKNKFDDLYEKIGEFLLPVAGKWVGWLNQGVTALNKMASANDRASTTSLNYSQKVKAGLEEVMAKDSETIRVLSERKIEGWGMLAKKDQVQLDATLERQKQNLKAHKALIDNHAKELSEKPVTPQGKGPGFTDDESQKKADDLAKKAEKEKQDLIEKATVQIDTANTTEEQLTNIRTNAMAQELIDKGQQDLAIQLLDTQATENKNAQDKKRTELAKKNSEQRSADIRSSFAVISALTNSHNKSLFIVGKAAAISGATMDTYAAATKALLIQPPWVGIALAAGVTAAGMANVHNILATPMAEGGMIMPTSGGTLARMAEVGKAEVAIPLDDERTKEKLRDVMGGGNTIVIQAGVVIADDYSLNEFVNKIDEKLYERQRNRRSYL